MTNTAQEISRPSSCKWDRTWGAVTLYWSLGDKRNGEYHLRGGICWPIQDRQGTGYMARGAVVLCGENVRTKRVTVFEEVDFLTVEPYTLDSTMHDGLTTFCNMVFSSYLADLYYEHQPIEMCKTYAIEMYRSRCVGRQPHFVHVSWDSDDQAMAVLPTLDATDRFRFRKDGLCGKALLRLSAQPTAFIAEVHALTCCLNGLRRFPWRKPEEEE